jgi:hypothetical protein
MTTDFSTLLRLYNKIADDRRVNVWHISLFIYILVLWQKNGYADQLKVSRKQLMTGAHFGSITTYHRCINHLKELHYIVYLPTYDSYQGTIIKVVI